MSERRAVELEGRPTVAHLNYSFFHSTQSFIAFSMLGCRRTRPICLTRAPESPAFDGEIPPPLRGDLYAYGGSGPRRRISRSLFGGGVALRRFLAARPPAVAEPALRLLSGRVATRLRADTDPEHYLAWAERIVLARDARLIHSYFGPIGWRTLELRRRLGLPLIVSLLGDEVAPTLSPWWSWWVAGVGGEAAWPRRLRELFREVDLLLVEGPHIRDRLLELGCPEEKVEVQRIAIPLERYPFDPRPPHPATDPVLLFAGRFCEQKGVLDALEAARLLRKQGHRFELRLVGDDTLTDGRYAARVHAFVREHRLEGTVRTLGFLNHADYLAELQRADVFVHPSVTDREGRGEGGAPTTIIEAQALGRPVVATVHCDIPNVTVPGESALLVDERDPEALAAALASLLDEPERREAMGRAGRRQVERRHATDREVPRLEERYLELIERGGRAPAEPGHAERSAR